jgi:hypothetical protein
MSVDPTRFLTQAVVRLFGWVVGEVTWKEPPASNAPAPSAKTPTAGAKTPTAAPTAQALNAVGEGSGALAEDRRKLAHVLAFSNEGRYTPFRAPALFLVPSDGEPVHDEHGELDPAKLGLAQLDKSMIFASNLKFWICDRSAYITRLDMSSGTLQRVVIDIETAGAQGRRIDLVGQESSYMARLGPGHY